ncbi:helix-turn-helix domain-containing protein [Christensenellaceae bacterium OttesenSCG-928-K19]|nr:helix-turn-helix domain-containing protein [Christensenellaceae bacterium OttesenSCG-928-K19]
MKDLFMKVDEVAKVLGVSKSYAYKLVHKLNGELGEKGYLTVAGRVSTKYFLEKVCYGQSEKTMKGSE